MTERKRPPNVKTAEISVDILKEYAFDCMRIMERRLAQKNQIISELRAELQKQQSINERNTFEINNPINKRTNSCEEHKINGSVSESGKPSDDKKTMSSTEDINTKNYHFFITEKSSNSKSGAVIGAIDRNYRIDVTHAQTIYGYFRGVKLFKNLDPNGNPIRRQNTYLNR